MQQYCKGIESIGDDRLVFLKETGFNLHILKHYGYSLVGSKAVINVPANRETNISLLCVINSSGIVGYKIKKSVFKRDLLLEFINRRLIPFFIENPHKILIINNRRFHHKNNVKALLNQNRITYMYLPAYSLQLNPIKKFLSHLKSVYSDIRLRPVNRDDIIVTLNNLLNQKTISFGGWYRHIRVWVARGIGKQLFE
ncbi:hypothetical protein CDIK_1886 [Cucumispora dikerogammari]|nr:hypothetical protein CDIK_1886 [Cucumispora dikerogammari]